MCSDRAEIDRQIEMYTRATVERRLIVGPQLGVRYCQRPIARFLTEIVCNQR